MVAYGKVGGWCMVSGLLLLAITIAWWSFIAPLIVSILKQANFILDEESPLFAEWESSYIPNGSPSQTPKFEAFYVFNITNLDQVIEGAIPFYEELGPYVYRANYSKFKIQFLEDDVIEYKEKNTFYFVPEDSYGSDRELVVNINPGYLGAVYIIGSENLMIQLLAGPAIDKMIDNIEEVYINGYLIPNRTLEYWLERCFLIDQDCKTTRDMAIIQWGSYSVEENRLGLNNEDMNLRYPEVFTYENAEYSSFILDLLRPPKENQISINSTKKLLYGEYGLVTNPENLELFLLSIGDDEEIEEKWGLTPGTGRYFVQYILSIKDTYCRALLDDIIQSGSGLFRKRSVWEILWEDIDPLLLKLSPQEPFANIFFNDTSEEVADKLTGPYRINNGRSNRNKVEELVMWNGYKVVDIFWEKVDIQVGGNSGSGQFPPVKLSMLGSTPDILQDLYVWSQDHGNQVVFKDTGLKESIKGVKTHFYSIVNETYDPSVTFDLPERFKGFINATFINEGVPVFYCQPRMWLVDDYWRSLVKGVQPPSWVDGSYLWLEPISGLAIKSDVKLQVNFYIPNSTVTPLFDVIYTKVASDIMFPLVWTQQYAELTVGQAQDLEDQLFIVLDWIRIAWYLLFAISFVLLAAGAFFYFRQTSLQRKASYQRLN